MAMKSSSRQAEPLAHLLATSKDTTNAGSIETITSNLRLSMMQTYSNSIPAAVGHNTIVKPGEKV